MSTDPDPLDLAYAAGIIDGEGCICARDRKDPRYRTSARLEVVVGMCNTVIIDWLSRVFPMGHRYTKKRPPNGDKWKTCELFIASNRQAVQVLKLILPYLKLKRRQAELGIELGELKAQSRPHHTFRYDRQLEIMAEMKRLNKKGL